MAVSPLVFPSASEQSIAKKAKLSNTAVSSNNGTPEVGQISNGAGRDLAEQMNEDEKSKYVKGPPPPFLQ